MRGLVPVVVLGLALPGAAVAAGPRTKTAPRTAPPPALPSGVRIAGVRVGGLAPAAAARAVVRAFDRPVPVVVDARTFLLRPANLATPYVAGAVRRAASARAGTNVSLVVAVHGDAVRAVVRRIARQVDHRAATGPLALRLRDGVPYVDPSAVGRRLDTGPVVRKVVHALAANTRLPLRLATRKVQPRALASATDPVIVIDRERNVLSLYRGTTLWRQFRVATGQAAYPTPAGRFQIVVKWRDPWWYPPPDPWAAGEKPTPPGPDNPLGTRWMGLSAPGVGIHGTPEPQSIGYSESHGCIRMLIPQAEWLFDHVRVGTTVFIV
jgi:lipoprotein-anchoring transpeptidase ErfK/SrfK